MLRVSIIGLGMAVEPHARSLLELRDQVEVRWAASPSSVRTEAFAARHRLPVTNDVQRAIADPEVDAVLLLTPPNTHLELAQLACEHGKHLLLEKPLDVSLDRAEAIVEAYASANLRLGVVLQHRFREGAQRLAELLRGEELGAVQAASVSVPWWRPQSYYDDPGRGSLARDGGGVLMTQAIHTLDLFRSMLGPVRVQAAQARTTELHRMETEDFVSALIELENGARGMLMATTAWFPGEPERIDVIGARGAARLVGPALEARWIDGRTERVGAVEAPGTGSDPMGFSHQPHKALIEDFCEAIRLGREPAASGRDALATQQLIADLLRAAGPTSSGEGRSCPSESPLEQDRVEAPARSCSPSASPRL